MDGADHRGEGEGGDQPGHQGGGHQGGAAGGEGGAARGGEQQAEEGEQGDGGGGGRDQAARDEGQPHHLLSSQGQPAQPCHPPGRGGGRGEEEGEHGGGVPPPPEEHLRGHHPQGGRGGLPQAAGEPAHLDPPGGQPVAGQRLGGAGGRHAHRQAPRRRRQQQRLVCRQRRLPVLPADRGQGQDPRPGEAGQEGPPPPQVLHQPEREDHHPQGEEPQVRQGPQGQGGLDPHRVPVGPGEGVPPAGLAPPHPRQEGRQLGKHSTGHVTQGLVVFHCK